MNDGRFKFEYDSLKLADALRPYAPKSLLLLHNCGVRTCSIMQLCVAMLHTEVKRISIFKMEYLKSNDFCNMVFER